METTTTRTSEWIIRYNGDEIATDANSVVAHAAARAQSMIVMGRVEMWSGLTLAYIYEDGEITARYY